jgi:hypothetical protein
MVNPPVRPVSANRQSVVGVSEVAFFQFWMLMPGPV